MSTPAQKHAGSENLKRAREVQRERREGTDIPNPPGLSTAEENGLGDSECAFPKERKEPLMDAEHVRNAFARFDQVEGVSDRERDQAWARIKRAARQYGVHVGESDWRELFVGGKERKQ
jgi:hypothetical protein